MQKLRVFIFFSTIVIVGAAGLIASYFARGYRFDKNNLTLTPSGLLVVNSEPNGAQIFINGELKTATNATISLPPDSYDVTVKKEGFVSWSKRLSVEKEIVTQVDISLFSAAPSLSAITFQGALNPVLSPDSTKVLYAVSANAGIDKEGLWVMEMVNLPIGFNREPRRIADGDMSKSTWEWSPNSREILLTTPSGLFLLPAGEFTVQSRRVNVASRKAEVMSEWQIEKTKRLESQLASLPIEHQDIFKLKAKDVVFSPNENKILFTASSSAVFKEGLVRQLPGSSTQKQVREIKRDQKYVYDIKEDRNFEIGGASTTFYWFPTSHHLIVPEQDKISIMDYDGTNKQTIYTGSFIFPHAYPTNTNNRLLILTSLGAVGNGANLYSLGIK